MGALALTACRRVRPLPELKVARLGWRWVPGLELRYRTEVTRRAVDHAATRTEEWSYQVVAFIGGVATLRGQLTGVGVRLRRGDGPWEDVRIVPEGKDVEIRLSLDGRMLESTVREWGEALPHRLLALRLPSRPVAVGEAWSEPCAVRALATLLPPELPAELTGSARLLALDRSGDGVEARLETSSSARVPGELLLRQGGEAVWDAERGQLARRRVAAGLRGEEATLEAVVRRV